MKSSLVAPLTGAWIETSLVPQYLRQLSVAPLTGAWIETTWFGAGSATSARRAPHGRVD